MYPDDRVLVGVINRKRDLLYAQQDHWYRIPAAKMPRGIYTEYIAFFLSGSAIYKKPSGIYYFARKQGVELVHRTDLLPKEPHHKNSKEIYYKIQFDEVLTKDPIVLNKTGRAISFIYTTWDRFINAEQIRDLYNKSDYYVDRIYHALRDKRIRPERYWQAEKKQTGYDAQLRIPCKEGEVIASTDENTDGIYLDETEPEDKILAEIRARIAAQGGPVMISIPLH